jgi:uncharacterized protein
MPSESTREGARPSWPLRVVLGLCVSALIIVGFQLNGHHATTADPTTSVHTTVTTTASGPTTSVHTTVTTAPTTTQPSPPMTNLPPPFVNMEAFKPPGAGCRFSTGAPLPGGTSSTTSTSTSIASTSTTDPPVTVIGHCTVLEIGDSLGNDLGWGMARQLGHDHALRLVQADKSSSGLLTPWFYDWAQKEKVLLAQYKPQLVIITFGANDEQNLKVNGHVLAFGSAPWVTAYTAIVTKMATAATNTGAYVLWVGMPIMQPNGYRQGMVLINSVFAKVATTVPGMTFLPTWDLFANAQGQFEDAARVNDIPSLLREADGIHFSYVGENVISTYVTRNIGVVYHVQITPEAAMYIDR